MCGGDIDLRSLQFFDGLISSKANFWGNVSVSPGHTYPQGPSYLFPEPTQVKPQTAHQDSDLRDQVYTRLLYADSIRLLRIEPGTNSPLKCQLETTRLSRLSHPYEAISYVWGTRPKRIQISSHAGPLSATQNLGDALYRLRLADRPRYVWADAICINQDDVAERNKQVRLMRIIYQRATQVLIWLGIDPEKEAIFAFSALYDVVAGITREENSIAQLAYKWNGVPCLSIPQLPGLHKLRADSPRWAAVAKLFDNPWFWRIWCVQEVALASSALVIWGECEMAWRWVGLAAVRMQAHYHQILQRYKMSGVFNAYLMYRISQGELDMQPLRLSFSHLVAVTRHFGATDPRDRIFGLLGLPATDSDPDNGGLFMDPDYSLPAHVIYCEYAHKALQSDRSLTLLSGVQHGQHLASDHGTWIPQLGQGYTRSLAPFEMDPNFSASADLGFEYQKVSDYIITLRGIPISTVSHALLADTAESNNGSAYSTYNLTQDTRLRQLFRDTPGQIRLSYTLTAGKTWASQWITDSASHLDDFAAFIKQSHPDLEHHFDEGMDRGGDADRFRAAADGVGKGRQLFLTHAGQLGLGPEALRPGDLVCVLFGAAVPFVLRPREHYFLLVGECYIHELMDGHVVKLWREGKEDKFNDQIFEIH